MAQKCDVCSREVYRTTYIGGKWVGEDCGCRNPPMIHDCDSPFRDGATLTLDHIHNERGEKVVVSSIRQLREAEKRHGFVHHASNMSKRDWGNAPQQRRYTIADLYQRKFQRGTV